MSEQGIATVISDFGGVLTTPLVSSFAAVQDDTGIPMEELGKAMSPDRGAARASTRCSSSRPAASPRSTSWPSSPTSSSPSSATAPRCTASREIYFEALHPNEEMIELMRELKASRAADGDADQQRQEWEPRWRSMLPVDEIFELVVDSGFVGMRKPDAEIYELTLERLGNPEPGSCLFVDDIEANVEAARELGISAVHYRHNDQAIAEIREATGLGGGSAEPSA